MDRWRNEEIRELLEIDIDVVEVNRRRRLSYFRHVSRIKPERIPAKLMHGWIHGSRPRGRTWKRWLDAVQEDCEGRGVTLVQAGRLAEDRDKWKNLVFRPPKRSFKSQGP